MALAAPDDELLALMRQAKYFAIFAGIETPDLAALVESRKLQNTHRDIAASTSRSVVPPAPRPGLGVVDDARSWGCTVTECSRDARPLGLAEAAAIAVGETRRGHRIRVRTTICVGAPRVRPSASPGRVPEVAMGSTGALDLEGEPEGAILKDRRLPSGLRVPSEKNSMEIPSSIWRRAWSITLAAVEGDGVGEGEPPSEEGLKILLRYPPPLALDVAEDKGVQERHDHERLAAGTGFARRESTAIRGRGAAGRTGSSDPRLRSKGQVARSTTSASGGQTTRSGPPNTIAATRTPIATV